MSSVITCQRVAQHCYPPRGPSLALRAIHLVLRLRRPSGLCSSTLSVNCEYFTKVTQWQPDCRSPFSERSPVSGLRQANKQGKGRSSKRKENRRLSFLFAPAAGAANPRAPQSATPPLRFSEHPRPLGANTLTRFVHPAGSVQRKKAAARKGAAPTCLVCPR